MTTKSTFYTGNWIDSIPDNFQWSNAALVAKGMAPWGAVALGEIDEVIQRLHARAKEPQAWWEEWSAIGARAERTADAAAAEHRDATAGNYYLRACNYYYTGERMLPPGEQKFDMYRKSLRCAHEGLKRRYKNVELVEVPYEGKSLPAYFMKAPNEDGWRKPTIVLFDGLDNCKEMSVIFAGIELAFRGFNTLAIDGPGQGEALRLRNIHARYDYEVAGTAAYDYVASRPDVDPKRVGIMAYSIGGYYAPRAAAFEKRYAALVSWGVIFDYHAVWTKRLEALKAAPPESQAASHFQLPWVLGVPDMDAAMKKVKDFTLAGVAEKIECPTLICHGEGDRLSTTQTANQLYDAVGAKDKTLKIFTKEDGGVEHCQVDNRQVGTDYICDWLSARLL
ncbi:MAG: dipeptidyl aminopeptidase/acylaminoacyl-peptidase-like protein [Betaproteobacteria bacterium]|nr:dipeptidyl aminopeptidase/acylaminoacyl-peptidase-like protein [Betaproteobacteria bacterium]